MVGGFEEAAFGCEANVFSWWLQARKSVPKFPRAGFDSLVFLIGCSIWKERNPRTFGGPSTQPNAVLLSKIMDEAKEWSAAGYRRLGLLLALL
jgi:hypothetical protein